MTKYNINKEYGILKYFNPPFNRMTIFISSVVLSNEFIRLLNNKKLRVSKEKIRSLDNKKISLYILEPISSKTDKVMLYCHGGAFVFKGSIKHHLLCKRYALEGDCKVVFVDYRLATKYKYPTPLDDCYSAYKWILNNTTKLKINPNKIIVAGDSAGGCLAAEVTAKTIKEDNKSPALQLLIYPVLDKRMKTVSMKKYSDTPIWNANNNKKMWSYYLKDENYLSPNEQDDYKEFPLTYIETAEFDCLHDEAIEYANKLSNSGIDVILNETKETMHGFEMKNTVITQNSINKRIDIIKNIDNKRNTE